MLIRYNHIICWLLSNFQPKISWKIIPFEDALMLWGFPIMAESDDNLRISGSTEMKKNIAQKTVDVLKNMRIKMSWSTSSVSYYTEGSLLNSVGGVGSVGTWIHGWRGWRGPIKFWYGSKKWRGWRGSEFWRGWRGSIKFWQGSKKKSVGRNFGMDLRCFIKKALLKISQSICAGVSREIELQAEDLKID